MTKPAWRYDEFRHFAVDFDDPRQVVAYDAWQGAKLAEVRQLVTRLGISTGQQVVEFGTGTGAFAQAAAEAGASVVAWIFRLLCWLTPKKERPMWQIAQHLYMMDS